MFKNWRVLAATLLLTAAPPGYAQFTTGTSLTAPALNAAFATKVDKTSAASQVQITQPGTGAVARTLADKLADSVNGRDYGMKCDGTTDDTTALINSVTTGKSVMMPPGQCVISGEVDLTTQGQIIAGAGKMRTTLIIPSTFPSAAKGVFAAPNWGPSSSNKEGPQFRDFGIKFTQPDTTVRANLTTYPPAFYMQNVPRFTMNNLRIALATIGVDMRGDSGGSTLSNIEMSAFNTGVWIDGSTDTVRLLHWHFWPFDVTSNQYTIWNDATQYVIQSARMDDLRISDMILYGAKFNFYQSANGVTFGTITGLDMDTMGGYNMSAGSMLVSSAIFSNQYANQQAVNLTGGSFNCSSCKFYSGVATTNPLVQVSGNASATLQISNSTFQWNGDMTLVGASSTGGVNNVTLSNNQYLAPANPTQTKPVINLGTGSRGTINGERITDLGSGSGTFLNIAADEQHNIGANTLTGWKVVYPSTFNNIQMLGNSSVGTSTVKNNLAGPLSLNDPSTTTTNSLAVSAASSGNGANIKITGNGTTTPSKTIRAQGGNFQVLNDAYTAPVLTVTDAGAATFGDPLTTTTNLQVKQSGTGAVTRSLSDKLSDVVNGRDYGMKCDGGTDDTSSLQAAITALGDGGRLMLPKGWCNIDSVTIPNQVVIEGQGAFGNGTYIRSTTAADNVFHITGAGAVIKNISFGSTVTRTGGAYIFADTTSSQVTIRDVSMDSWWYGIRITSPGGPFMMDNVLMRNGVPNSGEGFRIENGTDVAIVNSQVVNPGDHTQSPYSCATITGSSDVTLINAQLQWCGIGLAITPGAGQVVSSVYAVNSFFDNAKNYGVVMQPLASNAAITRVRIDSSWASSAGQSGILIDNSNTSGAAGIDGVEINSLESFFNANGITINTTGTGNGHIDINGGKFAGNTGAGIQVFNANGLKVANTRIGPTGAAGANDIGIHTAGTVSNLIITGNDLSGNTSGAYKNDTSSLTNNVVTGNLGIPLVNQTITVGASPYTWTNNTGETVPVVVTGGTVSDVSLSGMTVGASTNTSVTVPNGATLKVTYSSAPTLTYVGH